MGAMLRSWCMAKECQLGGCIVLVPAQLDPVRWVRLRPSAYTGCNAVLPIDAQHVQTQPVSLHSGLHSNVQ